MSEERKIPIGPRVYKHPDAVPLSKREREDLKEGDLFYVSNPGGSRNRYGFDGQAKFVRPDGETAIGELVAIDARGIFVAVNIGSRVAGRPQFIYQPDIRSHLNLGEPVYQREEELEVQTEEQKVA